MVHFRINGVAGAMAELRNVQENTELEVLPIADLFKESAKYHFFVGGVTQETSQGRSPITRQRPAGK